MEELKKKILEIIKLLKKRNNETYKYFEEILNELDANPQEIIGRLIKSYAITQYSNFNSREEKCFEEIWQIAKKLHK
jgi:hypothetical protein